jgi:hypothetical protein
MQIRKATDADVPAIAALVLLRATTEAPWNTFIPGGARKDQTFVQHAEALTRSYVEANQDEWVVMIVELSAAEAERSKPEIVAVAVWDTHAAASKAQKGMCFSLSLSLSRTPCLIAVLSKDYPFFCETTRLVIRCYC